MGLSYERKQEVIRNHQEHDIALTELEHENAIALGKLNGEYWISFMEKINGTVYFSVVICAAVSIFNTYVTTYPDDFKPKWNVTC